MANKKYALIATNYIGFFHFLWDDIDMLNNMGYKIYAVGDNRKKEEHTLKILAKKNVTFIDVAIDSKSPLTSLNLQYYNKVKNILKTQNFDLIHCHTPIVGLFVRLAARKYRRTGTKVIYTTHGLAYTHLSSKKEYFIYHTIESFASRLCDAIITINKEDYENASKLHCKQIFHINGVGVNTENFRNVEIDRDTYRNELGIAKDKIVILAIGELSQRKNHRIIIKALSLIPQKENYVFAICGHEITAGGTGSEIRELSKTNGINTIFLGFRRDIPQIIKCADIGVMPSIREGLGLAGIEMLSAGIPLIGSDVQGIREYIVNGKTGFLCNPYDAEAYAKGIIKLSDAELRKELAPNCKEIVKQFDKKISVAQRLEIYKKVLLTK